MRAYVWLPGRVGVCMPVRARSLTYPECNVYEPYCDVICGPTGSAIFFDIILQTARFSQKRY